jgi:hypothetical protein
MLLEALVGHFEVSHPEEPGEALINRELVETIEMFCREAGGVKDVGPEFYQKFLDQTEDEMRAVIEAVIENLWTNLYRFCRREATRDERVLAYPEPYLYLVARGTLGFSDDGRFAFSAPNGPRPTPDMQRRILDRIRADRHLVPDAIMAVWSGSDEDLEES